VLDVVQEIGARMGRAIAVYTLGSWPECTADDCPWEGVYPLDPDLFDELAAVNILPGTEEFRQAEAAAKEAYEHTMATEFAEE
jgi:hypothetical protein